MARCDRGYLCAACGGAVEELVESELYLRYVLGEVDPEVLHKLPERHIRCNPALAQFIVHESFVAPTAEGFFAKGTLDPEFVAEEEARVTGGYRRLLELSTSGDRGPILEYPPPPPGGGPARAEGHPAA